MIRLSNESIFLKVILYGKYETFNWATYLLK